MLTPDVLTCEYFPTPGGVDVLVPRLSPQVCAERHGARPKAYQILVGKDPAVLEDLAADLLGVTGTVTSGKLVHISYAGPTLQPSQRCDGAVRHDQ